MSRNGVRPLVIMGVGELAQLAYYYFTHDSSRSVAAFTVDKELLLEESFMGIPLVGYDTLEQSYPPDTYDIFIAIGYSRLNQARAEKYQNAKARGYRLATYISSRCTNYSDLIIGDNCLVMEGNLIQPYVTIGNNVILWSGCMISHHVDIGHHCFISARSVISGKTKIGECSFIGANATLRDNLTIGSDSIIGAGALILSSTEQNESYLGTASSKSGIPSSRMQSLL